MARVPRVTREHISWPGRAVLPQHGGPTAPAEQRGVSAEDAAGGGRSSEV